ncbi:hypothetical protein [Alloactinosynnema sp. L-07]|uniref:hypothetical protein n=1 Tax=Alloactinosynnema sp. L-07 TaxID=1653480 RepID=UPI00065F0BB0|nr:hypothetical protein [Alloactinosynnema sp. L-07]CRK55320.1 hypothetical protein [Alloactinosynnema sp. L-07]
MDAARLARAAFFADGGCPDERSRRRSPSFRPLTAVNPRKFVTSDMGTRLRDVRHLTVTQVNALLRNEHPGRTQPTT